MNRSDGIEIRFPHGYSTDSVGRASLCSYQCHLFFLLEDQHLYDYCIWTLTIIRLVLLGYYSKNASKEGYKTELPFITFWVFPITKRYLWYFCIMSIIVAEMPMRTIMRTVLSQVVSKDLWPYFKSAHCWLWLNEEKLYTNPCNGVNKTMYLATLFLNINLLGLLALFRGCICFSLLTVEQMVLI